MMTQDEFVFNGSKHRYVDNPEFPIGVNTALWHNAARADELPKGSVEWHTARNNAKSYPKHLKRPFGPVMSPIEALYRSDDMYDKKDRDPITGLTPWQTYRLTGGRQYVPDSIKLDDTPY